jgi:hypothetical protein
MANPFVRGIIAIAIGAIMVVNVLFPILKGANTSTWTSSEIALYSMLGLAALIVLVYGVFAMGGLA